MKIYDYITRTYITEDKMKIGTDYRIEGNHKELSVNYKVIKPLQYSNDIIVKRLPAKYSIKVECKKYENEDSYERTLWDSDYHRSLNFELTITCDDETTQDYIIDKIETSMRNELKEYNFQFSGCPTIENGQYWDCASIEYTHGQMTETKKAIMTAYKEAKKLLR